MQNLVSKTYLKYFQVRYFFYKKKSSLGRVRKTFVKSTIIKEKQLLYSRYSSVNKTGNENGIWSHKQCEFEALWSAQQAFLRSQISNIMKWRLGGCHKCWSVWKVDSHPLLGCVLCASIPRLVHKKKCWIVFYCKANMSLLGFQLYILY